MIGRALPALLSFALTVTHAFAQEPDAAQRLIGAWEISNAARDRTCIATFKTDTAPGGQKIELDGDCAANFPALKDAIAWRLANAALRLYDAAGTMLIEFTEVEASLYEGERRGEGIFFLQSQAAIAAAALRPDQFFGDWGIARGSANPTCTVTLSGDFVAMDEYKLAVKPGCDAVVSAFGLQKWRLERGELVLAGRGGAWRFEEADQVTWEQVPRRANSLRLIKR